MFQKKLRSKKWKELLIFKADQKILNLIIDYTVKFGSVPQIIELGEKTGKAFEK